MANGYAKYSGLGGGSGGGITAINSQTGPNISIVGGSGISVVTTPNTITISDTNVTGNETANTVFAGPASGPPAPPTFRALVSADIPSLAYANQSLSNLTSPTAVNHDLLPSSNNGQALGSSSFAWNSLFVHGNADIGALAVIDPNTSTNVNRIDTAGVNSPNGTVGVSFWNVDSGTTFKNLNIFSSFGLVSIETANNGSGNSQNIVLQTGTATGTRGQIVLNGSSITASTSQIHNVVDPTSAQDAATKNYVDGAAFANKTLSNLTSPTAINQNLLPGSNNTLTLGDSTHKWLSLDVTTIANSGLATIAVNAKQLLDNSGNAAVDWNSDLLNDPTNILSLDWQNRRLFDLAGTESAEWDNRILADSSPSVSVDWQNKILYSGGNSQINWNTIGAIFFNSNLLSQVLDPVSAQDAATKNYVDTNFFMKTSQSANLFLASPNGSSGVPTFRSIVAADVPTLNQNTTGTASNVTGTVAIAHGGTGQTTKAPAFDALSPMTTGGDLIYGGASGTGTRLANGSSGQFLMSNGGTSAPSWNSSASALNKSYVYFDIGNGFGSNAGNVIRRFTTQQANTGTGITYADSSTDGATFTINENGVYSVNYSDFSTGSANIGISLNSSQLTTAILSITDANILATTTISANATGFCAWTGPLVNTDIIRAHTDGGVNNNGVRTRFSITKVANLP